MDAVSRCRAPIVGEFAAGHNGRRRLSFCDFQLKNIPLVGATAAAAVASPNLLLLIGLENSHARGNSAEVILHLA
jgi:hypothetical protein